MNKLMKKSRLHEQNITREIREYLPPIKLDLEKMAVGFIFQGQLLPLDGLM